MSTYMAKVETLERKWYVIDAAGKPIGKTAAAAATILRGKHRPEFTPHVDCGEFVIIINALILWDLVTLLTNIPPSSRAV